MKTKEEILGRIPFVVQHDKNWFEEKPIKDAMSEYAEEMVLAFEKWLSENTEVIKEEKITLYRYCDKNNEWGNYTLEDIYWVFIDPSPTTVNK